MIPQDRSRSSPLVRYDYFFSRMVGVKVMPTNSPSGDRKASASLNRAAIRYLRNP